MISLGVVIYSS